MTPLQPVCDRLRLFAEFMDASSRVARSRGDLRRERGDERAHLLGVAQGLQPEERIADGLRRELLPARRNLARRQLAEMTEIPDTG